MSARTRVVGVALAILWLAVLVLPLSGVGMKDRLAAGPTGAPRIEWTGHFRPAALGLIAGVVGLVVVAVVLRIAWDRTPMAWRPRALGDRVRGFLGVSRARRVAAWVALAAGVVAIPDLFGSQGDKYAQVCFDAALWVLLALGLNLVVGMAGLLVLGYAAFVNVGAYVFAILSCRYSWSFWECLPAGAVAGALAGLLLGLPSLRLRGDYLAIVTLGFGESLRFVLVEESWLTGGPDGIPCSSIPGSPSATTALLAHDATLLPRIDALRGTVGGRVQLLLHAGMDDPFTAYYIALAFVAVGVLVAARLSHSRFGRALFALREDEIAARAMGIATNRLKVTAFVVAAAWAAVVGVLAVGRKNQITPDDFKFEASVLVLSMVVLGGLGSVRGAVLGALVLHFVPFLLQEWFPAFQGYRLLVFGAVLVVLMVARPQGLFGTTRGLPAGTGGGAAP